ncbi:MAG: hypothetical protein ACRDZ5_09110 [Acidimicrobiales bacterium]
MRRSPRVAAASGLRAGAVREAGAGTKLVCVVLVAGPEWVAVDGASGAYLRPYCCPAVSPELAVAGEVSLHAPLGLVELTLGPESRAPDPSRPEAVTIALHKELALPARRVVRRLIGRLVTKAPELPLLGSIGPSVAYCELDGNRPSVVLVSPDQRPRFGNGPSGPWCQFSLAGRRHSLAFSGRPEEAHGQLLVVGYGRPRGGQVPKIVLGVINERAA